MQTLVTLATYEQSKTACFLKEKFEAVNIDCFFAIISTNDGEWDEVRVQVKEEDVERAIKVMLRIKDEHGMDIENIDPANLLRRIIVPTDFSKDSEYACQYAIHLAQKINAEIKLLHIYPDPISELRIKESATYLDYIQSTLKENEKRANNGIIEFAHKMKIYMDSQKISNVRIHSSLAMGNIIGKIKGVSLKYKPDVIVLGTEGRREDSKSVLSGLTKSIISGLEVPVYAIPGPCSPEDFQSVRILYATDFNEKDHNSLERLLKIVEPFDKQVTCIHIDTAHNPAKIERMDELNAQLKKDYGKHDIKCQLIEDEDVYHGMKDFASRNQINLLSFTVHKRGIFEKLFKPNLFKRILQESNLPILLFPS
ncbi:MAG: universal stress protein [Bacteroidota bacterium]|nr:universal stress protein [Bacteroidota bacterium]